jgi:uncharacterized membrane protein (UPF0127 family)
MNLCSSMPGWPRCSGAVLAALILMSAGVAACREEPRMVPAETSPEFSTAEPSFRKHGELVIMSPESRVKVKIDIEIAESPDEVEIGLMGRSTMEENQGMLFLFPGEEYRSFWMKNTILPLDMLFINADMEIVTIQADTTPFSEQSYPSSRPARYVLEVNAGFARDHGIRLGDRVFWQRM